MKYTKSFLIVSVLLILFLSSLQSQGLRQGNFEKKVDEYVRRYVSNGDFSGNVLIAKGDKILFERSYGSASYELSLPMKKDIKFRIASVSKTFTAAAIMLLGNKGLLSISDKLGKYFPDFINADSITIQQLLLHQSGVADIEYDKFALDKLSLTETINSVKKKPLYFKPGSQSRYSNTGYLILAAIIEKISGVNYEKFLAENIFSKLDMNNTGAEHRDQIILNKATGYSVGTGANGIANASWYDINLETGSGSLYSTSGDLLKWLKGINNKTLFDINSWVYPYGWGKREFFKGKKSFVQSGFLSGYSSYIALYPSDDLFIVVLSNISSNFNEDSGKDLAAIYFNEKYELPDIRKEIEAKDLNKYTGKYSWEGYKDFFIERKEDAIYWRFVDEKAGSPLAPVSDDAFLLRLINAKIVFKKDNGGRVTELSFGSGSNVTSCKKIE